MFGFEPGADGSGSKYANHCAMLLPLPPSIEESFDSVLAHNFLSPSEGSIKTNKIVGNEMKLQITIFFSQISAVVGNDEDIIICCQSLKIYRGMEK